MRRNNGFQNNNFRRDNFNREPRKMHKAVCSGCKKECEVPFKPTEGKEVFCKECFAEKKPKNNRNGNFNRRDNFRRDNFNREPRKMHKAVCSGCKKECEVPFKPTEGKEVFCKECFAEKKS